MFTYRLSRAKVRVGLAGRAGAGGRGEGLSLSSEKVLAGLSNDATALNIMHK